MELDKQENSKRAKEVKLLKTSMAYHLKFGRPYPCRYTKKSIDELIEDMKRRIKENDPLPEERE